MNSDEMIAKYIDELLKWNRAINLTSIDGREGNINRNINDSLQIMQYLDNDDIVLDIGTGAGLPGIIISIYGQKDVILCDKSYKKCIFLTHIKSILKLDCKIINCSINDIIHRKEYIQPTIAISRAYARLHSLIENMVTLHIPRGLFHKGRNYKQELDEAMIHHEFKHKIYPSETSEDGVIIEITEVKRRI